MPDLKCGFRWEYKKGKLGGKARDACSNGSVKDAGREVSTVCRDCEVEEGPCWVSF